VNAASARWEGRPESTVAWKALNPHCCCGVGRRKQEKPTESHVPF